jgi:hypothetical protein
VLRSALGTWLVILAFACANGALREGVLVPHWGLRTGGTASVVLLSTVVLLMAWRFVRRAGIERAAPALSVGGLWTAMTLTFEFGFGRARGLSWEALLADYDVAAGRLWPVVLLCTLLGPWAALRLASPTRTRAAPSRLLGGLLAFIAVNAVGAASMGSPEPPASPRPGSRARPSATTPCRVSCCCAAWAAPP